MLPGFERAALDILHHHESFDGRGYPAGLKETEIPIVSRIVTVIDALRRHGLFPPLPQRPSA
jgi:HD-GYP domain-containing protein (c-di-GMP phosphodiesterase class II)